jgi:hypothetical protein
MEKPRKVVYANGGQTKVTLIGQWAVMTGDEIEREYTELLEAGDPWALETNDVLCRIWENANTTPPK